jgi:hypothetical protein
LALRDEWNPTYPGIERVFKVFMRAPNSLLWNDLTPRLDNCALLTSDKGFNGTQWMTELSASIWNHSPCDDSAEVYQPLICLLYNVGFIGLTTSRRETIESEVCLVDKPVLYSYDEPNFPDYLTNLRRVTCFTVHPAFRSALDISEPGWPPDDY